ncbi:hypothetical protein [Euzebya pacifica]|nr:hypothetical protein [Euzebya pacifica]
MGRPPLVASFLGRCRTCTRTYKGTVDLRTEPCEARTRCPWCGVEDVHRIE